MNQCEDREEGVPPSKTTLCGEHESQTKAQRNQPGPPPSCVFLKGDKVKDIIKKFEPTRPFQKKIHQKLKPEPSCVSLQSGQVKKMINTFEQREPSGKRNHQRVKHGPELTCVSVKNDVSNGDGCSPADRSEMEKALPVQLLEMLKKMGEEELKLFHFYLQYEPGDDFPKLYKYQLENADRLKTVEVMVQAYSDRVMEVARLILEKMNEGSRPAQEALTVSSEEDLQSCQFKLKSNLKKKLQCVFEGVAKAGNPTLLKQIYTELYITEGGTAEINDEYEVKDLDCRLAISVPGSFSYAAMML
ncbi:uncharacterized protein LOC120436300 [Oreochromis aureus]|uniref:uncharacterized protein LOC120436300 n=1 Tax=Oreochromis aureus TaxID=47969 RepID=UPI001952C05A|nr:uncharacterized protein LOC120436300 [Oreochromis aureus]